MPKNLTPAMRAHLDAETTRLAAIWRITRKDSGTVACVTNDTAWHTLVATWRPRRLELYVDGISRANSTAANTNTSDAFGIYRWGWGFSTSQDFNGDIALILCCGACWTGHMVRRWHADPFGFLRPWNEVPALMASAPPVTPPSTGNRRRHLPHGVASSTCQQHRLGSEGGDGPLGAPGSVRVRTVSDFCARMSEQCELGSERAASLRRPELARWH